MATSPQYSNFLTVPVYSLIWLVCLYKRPFLGNTPVVLTGPAWTIYPDQTFQCRAWTNCQGCTLKTDLACWPVENQKATFNKLSKKFKCTSVRMGLEPKTIRLLVTYLCHYSTCHYNHCYYVNLVVKQSGLYAIHLNLGQSNFREAGAPEGREGGQLPMYKFVKIWYCCAY